MDDLGNDQGYHAWNTGVRTTVPSAYAPLATVVRPENVYNSAAEIKELSEFLNLPPQEVVRCRPERLILHETLLRVMCEVNISEGENYTGYGTNFRRMARTILDGHVMPHMDDFRDAYEEMRARVDARVLEILDESVFNVKPPAEPPKGFLKALD